MCSALLVLRELIFSVAQRYDEIGELEEMIKWGSPSYLTSKPKTGTTIRLSGSAAFADEYGIYVHCQSTLIAEFKEVYPELKYDGNRGLVFSLNQQPPLDVAEQFIYLALSYHYRKKHGIAIE